MGVLRTGSVGACPQGVSTWALWPIFAVPIVLVVFLFPFGLPAALLNSAVGSAGDPSLAGMASFWMALGICRLFLGGAWGGGYKYPILQDVAEIKPPHSLDSGVKVHPST